MCGFAGFVSVSGEVPTSVLEKMGMRLKHRGPDEQGGWSEGAVNMVHRRLAIQDLSVAGAQPMASASGRYIIAFNGEIYNFLRIKKQFETAGLKFRGHSDTEVLLAAVEQWGLEQALRSFSGMFAFSLLDREENKLYLARDRMGEKPLYYGWQGKAFLFGSELKALCCHPEHKKEINRDALPLLLRHNLIPAPYTIYKGIFKLEAATFLTLELSSLQAGHLPQPETYWSLADCFQPVNTEISINEAGDHLEQLLDAVISDQMVSDVPLGAFLSGGIDSSTVVAIMQKNAKRPVKTFSIGFKESAFNEANYAHEVAMHLGTDHTELYVTPDEGLEVIPRLPEIYDEPFADSSQIPTFLVSQMTKQHVTVALSGDGGDELFCGYTRYPGVAGAWADRNQGLSRLRRWFSILPVAVAVPLIKVAFPGQRSREFASIAFRLLEEESLAKAVDLQAFYRARVSFWPFPDDLVIGSQEPEYALTGLIPKALENDALKTLMWLDLNWYLPDDILTKVDRAAMACSLETRIPFLDRRIVEFALKLPTDLNIQDRVGKQVLRNILYRYVPPEMVERSKQGFAVPIGDWLRGSLRDWAEDLLDSKKMQEQGFFQVRPIRNLWKAHLAGEDDHAFRLWGILMFQAWLQDLNN